MKDSIKMLYKIYEVLGKNIEKEYNAKSNSMFILNIQSLLINKHNDVYDFEFNRYLDAPSVFKAYQMIKSYRTNK